MLQLFGLRMLLKYLQFMKKLTTLGHLSSTFCVVLYKHESVDASRIVTVTSSNVTGLVTPSIACNTLSCLVHFIYFVTENIENDQFATVSFFWRGFPKIFFDNLVI